MMATYINEEEFVKFFSQHINKAMMKAAKPLIKKALEEIEIEMRKELGAYLIGFMDSNMVAERMGVDLRIILKQALEKE